MTPNPLIYATQPVDESEYSRYGIAPFSHVLVEYDREEVHSLAGVKTGPEPRGVSGGGLWRLGGLLAENPAQDRLIGVMVEHYRTEARMITTRIGLVTEAIRSLFPELSDTHSRFQRANVRSVFPQP